MKSSHSGVVLYTFDDNEPAINMIIKGRSPTMRRVSRTHRVAFVWLSDRINLDPKIQIKYVDTKKQLADVLTKGNFTRDEWNHLLCLFNISNFSSASCPKTIAKRMQEEKGEEVIVATLKPTLNLVSQAVASSSTAPSSSASNHLGILKASSQRSSLKASAGSLVQLNIQISMTQRRVLKCGNQMQRRTTVRGDSLLQEETRTWIFKPGQGDLPQQIQTSSKTTQSDRIITAHLVFTYHI